MSQSAKYSRNAVFCIVLYLSIYIALLAA